MKKSSPNWVGRVLVRMVPPAPPLPPPPPEKSFAEYVREIRQETRDVKREFALLRSGSTA
ncbi:hypothetical protein [Candidatus Palauibacter sp.]|uniref:hypothetical protein n=1 Tax=Candidatus Palauibacter sp. TaxID=3101350 RepID=UPI003CC6A07D